MGELYDREKMAIEELKDAITSGDTIQYEQDLMHEIADGCTPIYNSDVLQCAMDNMWLATESPELEYENPLQGIQYNIYDHLMEKLYEYWNDEGESLYNDYQMIEDDYEDIYEEIQEKGVSIEDDTALSSILSEWGIENDSDDDLIEHFLNLCSKHNLIFDN